MWFHQVVGQGRHTAPRSGAIRNLLLGVAPHALVQRTRGRRQLSRLASARSGTKAWELARSARLDLLPPGALAQIETAVDVGANEGSWSVAVAILARPSKIIAVEPAPEAAQRLRSALAGTPGAVVVEAAVTDTRGSGTLNITRHSHNVSLAKPRSQEMDSLYGGGYEVRDRIVVETRTLDDITAGLPAISLLKIDVQGFERAVLEGAPQALAKTRWLLIEVNFRSHYEGDSLFAELHEQLAASGFVLTGLSRPRIEGGVALWCDALYTRAPSGDG